MKAIPRQIRFIFSVGFFLLLLMSLLRLLAYYFLAPPDLSLYTALKSFCLGFRFDAREAGILTLVLLLVGSIPGLDIFKTSGGRKTAFVILFIAILFVEIFFVFDFLHFRYLLQRLNASALSFLADAKISGSMVWQTYPVIRILLLILSGLLLLFWLVRLLYRKIANEKANSSKKSRVAYGVIGFLLCALAIFGRVGQYPLRWSDAFDLGSDFQANLALNPFQSFFSSLSFRSSTYNLESVKKYYPFMSGYLGVNKPDSGQLSFERIIKQPDDSGSVRHPNIVLVICESFSGYKSSMWGNPLQTTPFFNSLCKEGLFFDNCFTPAYGTARGVWASVTGVPDVELNKTASRNPSMVDQHSIINDFKGYEKFYFLGGSTSWANIRGVLTNNISGLHLYEEQDYSSPKIDVWGISDKNLFKEAGAILKQQEKPFFAVIQTADNHRPYTIADADAAGFTKLQFPADSLKKYGFESNEELNAFRFTDFCYQSFIEAARKEKYFSNTVFLFIGDHGIGGNAGNMFPRSWSDNGLTQYHVPLLIYAPGIVPAQRLHCIASQVDVLPTLAGIAGIDYRNSGMGRDLIRQYKIDSGKNNIAFIFDPNNKDIGVINGPWFYTRDQQGKHEKLLWADFANPEPTVANDSLTMVNRNYTSAFFETARYLLMNNKKK
jgi:phosphoglycerol transferase MdoB-like AlkP superfamily enzyme